MQMVKAKINVLNADITLAEKLLDLFELCLLFISLLCFARVIVRFFKLAFLLAFLKLH